jgi:hypothetical protein
MAYIFIYKYKINRLENRIQKLFQERNNIIPSIYDITSHHVTKHNDIFRHILLLRTKDFSENNFFYDLAHKMHTYEQIHNELNFIFKIANKHPELLKNKKFLYIRDLVIDLSHNISTDLELYKQSTSIYNKHIKIKNSLILGLFIPLKPIIRIEKR